MDSPTAKSENSLKNELAFYETKKSEWLHNHANEFVVISGEQAAGFYPDFEGAYKAGVRTFGVQKDFLIKQVCATEPVYVVY